MKSKFILGVIISFVFSTSFASEYSRYNTPVIETTNNYYSKETIKKAVNQEMRGVTLAAASGQHHYKAGDALQWSVGGAYYTGSDDSAFSFGIGKQYGSVFLSTAYSTDGEESMVTGAASGTF